MKTQAEQGGGLNFYPRHASCLSLRSGMSRAAGEPWVIADVLSRSRMNPVDYTLTEYFVIKVLASVHILRKAKNTWESLFSIAAMRNNAVVLRGSNLTRKSTLLLGGKASRRTRAKERQFADGVLAFFSQVGEGEW